MKDAFIIDAVRTPIGKFGGTLSSVRADDLAALAISELMKRNKNIDPADVDDVILGSANQAGEDNRNVARMALLLAGLPVSVPGVTVNRLCASGMNAAAIAAQSIQANSGDLFIAGGVEHMTRAPYVLSKSAQPFGRDAQLFDTSIGWRFVNSKMKEIYGMDSMGNTAENVAELHKISREDQDLFALRSQQKAAAAEKSGRLAKERFTIEIPQRKADPIVFNNDEFIRSDTSTEALAKLKPAFRFDGNGSVTAGNSSGINDGAAAILIASEDYITKNKLNANVRIVASAAAGVEPRLMGMGPVPSSQKVLKRAGLSLADIDVIELNEAFAAQSLACLRELGLDDNDPRVNINGGAIAIGHPLGMSGARLIQTAALQLEIEAKRYALCTMCIGVGQGMAIILERV
ncbi:MAG: 3-oxoadipyl-CoA thiolase [Calditrichaeota bacterium]|nr:3-oxoadipyl-CoA thiolase [Calditrichota bacterium]